MVYYSLLGVYLFACLLSLMIVLFCLYWLDHLCVLFVVMIVVFVGYISWIVVVFDLMHCSIIVLLNSVHILLLDVYFYFDCDFTLISWFGCSCLFVGMWFVFDLCL